MKRLIAILFFIISLIFLGGIIFRTYKESLPQVNIVSNLDPYKIYDSINKYRFSKNLKKLNFNQSMCAFTDKRLSQIHDNYSHDGFLNIKNYYQYVSAGENLADNPNSAITEWILSPEHRENILNPNYTDTCIAVDSSFAVQEFASF